MSKWFDKSKKIIVFGAHEREDIYTDHQKIVKCDLCGQDMYINIGMYPDDKLKFNVPPPEKYDLVFAKECFADLALELLKGAEVSKKYLEGN